MSEPPALEAIRADATTSGTVLDFDGTLSAIVEDPDLATPVPGATQLLSKLSSRFKCVALVSGRRAEQLASTVGVDGVRYVGLYGAEEIIGGRLYQSDKADVWRGMASRLARDASAFFAAEGLEGCRVEFKDLAVSLHYRNSSNDGAGEMIMAWAAPAAARRGFEANAGRMVVELRPTGVTKANALQHVVERFELSHLVVAGDDSSDVEMLQRAKSLLGGAAWAVGVESPEAPSNLSAVSDTMVSSPEELVELLGALVG